MTLLYANVNATYIFHRIWRLFTVSHNPQTLLLHTAKIYSVSWDTGKHFTVYSKTLGHRYVRLNLRKKAYVSYTSTLILYNN